jgi:hypothetical protein
MSFAACDERCARLRMATTAAAAGLAGARRFTAALSAKVGLARDLVDHADDVGDLARVTRCAIALTACATTWPPRSATWRVPAALAWWAFSAFFFTVAEISSIEAEVSSRPRLLLGAVTDRSSRRTRPTRRQPAGGAGDRLMVCCSCSIVLLKSSRICLYLGELGQAECEVAADRLEPLAERFHHARLLSAAAAWASAFLRRSSSASRAHRLRLDADLLAAEKHRRGGRGRRRPRS